MIAVLLLVALFQPVNAGKSKKLKHPECIQQLESDDALWVRNAKRAYGTTKAVTLFKKAVWAIQKRYKGTHRLPVGDLSFRGGGRIKPHKSHKDGRDIDVGYYFKDGRFRKWFGLPKRGRLDTARQWALFKELIDTGEVKYIFVDYGIQRRLYKHAIRHGETKRSLRKLIQWPRNWKRPVGVIRWSRGHDDHFHVRFRK